VKVKLPTGTKVTAIAAGLDHALALTSTGAVLAWGWNPNGQLGDGGTKNSDVPVKVKLPTGTTVIKIAAGNDHSLALASTGAMLSWGWNLYGQLGNGRSVQSDVPVPVELPAGTKVTKIAAGDFHSLVVTSTGGALAWGYNSRGQLGDGRYGGGANSNVPVQVKLPGG
jgi:alpha-tubulin suppressor-like RCC1 family protein